MPGNRSYNYPTQSPGGEGDVTGLAATAPLNVTDSGGPVPTVFIDPAGASANDYLKYNGTAVVWAAIPAGGVSAVTASAPLASSGGGSPNISLTGIVPQANGGLGVDASAFSNGVLVKSGGVMSSATAPTVSGVNISDGTVRLDSIASQGASLNAILRWNGTNWGITTSPSANFLLTSGASAPGWSNSLTGITINAATNSLSNIATSMLASGFNLAATQGGTGQTSYTVGDVLYASTTTALSKLAAGTSGRVLTANGAGVAPSYQALPTGTTVSTTLTGTTWTSTTFVDTGQKIKLPSGGLWQITFKVRNYCQVSSGAPGVNTFELYDNTAAAVITDSQAFGAADYIGGGSGFGTTTTWSVIIDVASGRDIKLYVKRLAGPTYAASGTGMASDTTEGTSTATAVLLRS